MVNRCSTTNPCCYRCIRVVLCVILCIIIFLVCQTLLRFNSGLLRSWGHPLRNAGVESCPACYGLDLCPQVYSDDLDYYCPHFNTLSIASLFGVKNVYYACSRLYGDVVIKKLGHDHELYQLDSKTCAALGQKGDCDFSKLADPFVPLERMIKETVTYRRSLIEKNGFGTVLCPTTKNMDRIIAPFLTSENGTSFLNRIHLAHVWTMLNINSEPVILKYINNSTEGWPVPVYLGACGRSVIETYEGEMLSDFMSESWENRARLAVNLLKAAEKFTFNHSDFRFYLTDISMENIVMSKDNMWQPVFVDLENIVIVDKNVDEDDRPSDWHSNHTSEIFECSDCFAFSTEDICNHHLSDHNYYAMCKFISESVLYSVPKSVFKISPNIVQIMEQCISPGDKMDRFEAADILIAELEKILV